MTTQDQRDRRIHAFLAEGHHELPARVYDAVRARVLDDPRKGRRPPRVVTRRLQPMTPRGSFAMVTVLFTGVVLVGVGLLARGLDGPGESTAPTATHAPPESRGPSPAPSGPTPAERGRLRLHVEGLRFSVRLPTRWGEFSPDYPSYVTRNWAGSQGAEAQVMWAAYPSRTEPFECFYLRDRAVDPTVDALSAAVAAVPGTRLLEGPTKVVVGGLPASRVVFVVEDDVGCDPGFFFLYPNSYGGALWPETTPGDTVRVWIVATTPRLLFIEGKTHPAGDQADAELEADIDSIVASLEFEQP